MGAAVAVGMCGYGEPYAWSPDVGEVSWSAGWNNCLKLSQWRPHPATVTVADAEAGRGAKRPGGGSTATTAVRQLGSSLRTRMCHPHCHAMIGGGGGADAHHGHPWPPRGPRPPHSGRRCVSRQRWAVLGSIGRVTRRAASAPSSRRQLLEMLSVSAAHVGGRWSPAPQHSASAADAAAHSAPSASFRCGHAGTTPAYTRCIVLLSCEPGLSMRTPYFGHCLAFMQPAGQQRPRRMAQRHTGMRRRKPLPQPAIRSRLGSSHMASRSGVWRRFPKPFKRNYGCVAHHRSSGRMGGTMG